MVDQQLLESIKIELQICLDVVEKRRADTSLTDHEAGRARCELFSAYADKRREIDPEWDGNLEDIYLSGWS